MSYLQPGDMRLLVCLFLTSLLVAAIMLDMGNLVDIWLWTLMIPFVVIKMTSRKQYLATEDYGYEGYLPSEVPAI